MLKRLNHLTIVLVPVGVFLILTVGAMVLTEVSPFDGSGFINSAAAQNRSLEDRVLSLERQVANLNSKMEQVATMLDLGEGQEQPGHNETASPTPTTVAATINVDMVLLVQAEQGNVREGPGTNYSIIGKVQAGDRLGEVMEESDGWYRFCCVDGDKPGWLSGSLVTAHQIGEPPLHLNADPFYQKHLDVGGVPILAPESIPDEELWRAWAITLGMVADRPDLLNVLAQESTRVLLYDKEKGRLSQVPEFADYTNSNAAGLFGETSYGGAVVAPANTPYHCSATLIHEIAHALDYAIRIQDWHAKREPGFKQARNQTYLSAMSAGLWAGRYESTLSHEYWAEMVEHYLRPDVFRTQFGLRDLSEYDSRAARLIEQYLGNPTLPEFCQTMQFSIRGRILDERGNPVPDIWVTLSAWKESGNGRLLPLRRHPDVVAERTGLDGRFWIVDAIDPGLLEAAKYFTLGIWRGEPAEWWPACSVAGIAGHNRMLLKGLGRERRIEITGENLSGFAITIPGGFDWEPIMGCK